MRLRAVFIRVHSWPKRFSSQLLTVAALFRYRVFAASYRAGPRGHPVRKRSDGSRFPQTG
ncbi:exported hypothetical protein [Candidatus Sulfopaludibacter sp. SbA4]|nr:exported hypothetical protein [Candidatus Sulfopaludibacter sp. SbA4]